MRTTLINEQEVNKMLVQAIGSANEALSTAKSKIESHRGINPSSWVGGIGTAICLDEMPLETNIKNLISAYNNNYLESLYYQCDNIKFIEKVEQLGEFLKIHNLTNDISEFMQNDNKANIALPFDCAINNDKYCVVEVEGNSMNNGTRDAIYDKDKLLCREVKPNLWEASLLDNSSIFVIVHKEEGVIVKQINNHNVETSEIDCHSLNPMFEGFTLNLNDVLELYNVIKIIDRDMRIQDIQYNVTEK